MTWRDLDPEAPPDPSSVIIMKELESWSRGYRMLAREFGFKIVLDTLAESDGSEPKATDLFDVLEVWRERRQAEWLATNFITHRTRDIFKAALARSRRVAAK